VQMRNATVALFVRLVGSFASECRWIGPIGTSLSRATLERCCVAKAHAKIPQRLNFLISTPDVRNE
jgi:hypothetical protein